MPSGSVWVPVVICCEQNDRKRWNSPDGVAENSSLLECYALLNDE
jgi:hypothetical protein